MDDTQTEAALARIRQRESGGQNVYNYKHAGDPTGYTASGYYQITDPTWRGMAPSAGVDTARYPTAISAPFDVQHAVAKALFQRYSELPWAASAPGGSGTSPGNMGVADANLPVPPVPPMFPPATLEAATTPVPSTAGPNPAAMLAASQAGQDNLASIVSRATQPMNDYYKGFFDPSNAGNV